MPPQAPRARQDPRLRRRGSARPRRLATGGFGVISVFCKYFWRGFWQSLVISPGNSCFWNEFRRKSGKVSKNHKNALQKREVANLHGRAPPSLTRSGVRRAPMELGHGSTPGFFSGMYAFWATFRNCRFFFPGFTSMCHGLPVTKDLLTCFSASAHQRPSLLRVAWSQV